MNPVFFQKQSCGKNIQCLYRNFAVSSDTEIGRFGTEIFPWQTLTTTELLCESRASLFNSLISLVCEVMFTTVLIELLLIPGVCCYLYRQGFLYRRIEINLVFWSYPDYQSFAGKMSWVCRNDIRISGLYNSLY